MKALITGIAGFSGSHLAEHLIAAGDTVVGVTRDAPVGLPTGLTDRVTIYVGDAGDRATMCELLGRERPEAVYHLAARANVAASWQDPEGTYRDNILGQLGLLEAVRAVGLRPRLLIAGSHEEYGRVAPDELPVREDNPLRPLSPYAVSKVAQDF